MHRKHEKLLETTLSSLLVSKCKEDKRNRRITQYFTLLNYTMNEESDTQIVRRRTKKRKRSPCRRDSLRSDSPLQPDRKRTRLLSSESESSSSSVSGYRLHRPVAGVQQILNNNGSSHESGSEGHDILCTANEREGMSTRHEPGAASITEEREVKSREV
jgi:hypothetical protein